MERFFITIQGQEYSTAVTPPTITGFKTSLLPK